MHFIRLLNTLEKYSGNKVVFSIKKNQNKQTKLKPRPSLTPEPLILGLNISHFLKSSRIDN